MDFGGQRAGEILFERQGVSGNPEPSIPAWQGIARNPADGASGHDSLVGRKRTYGITSIASNSMKSNNPHSGFYEAETSRTLDLNGGNPACNQGGIVICEKEPISIDHVITTGGNCTAQGPCIYTGGIMATLKSSGVHAVCAAEAYTLKIRSGCEGGGKGALVQTEKSATLSTLQDQTLFCLKGNIVDRTERSGANGIGVRSDEKCFTLNTTDRHVVVFEPGIASRCGGHVYSDVSGTLRAEPGDNQLSVAMLLNDQGGQSMTVESGDVSPTLRAESHAHEPVVCLGSDLYNGAITGEVFCSITSATGKGAANTGPTVICMATGQANAETLNECCPTLSCNHEQPIVFRKAMKPHSKDEAPRWEADDVASTLNTFDVGETRVNELVVFENHPEDARYTQLLDVCPTCVSRWGTGGNNTPLVAFAQNQRDEVRDLGDKAGSLAAEPGMKQQTFVAETLDCRNGKCNGDLSGTLQAKENGGFSCNYINPVAIKRTLRWIVRRLTPTECERLQGFPDGWTDIGEWVDQKGKKHKPADGPRYKALGNSIALPQWWWIACKMAPYLPDRPTLGSLFDGIGGFPLVWETRFGKVTAVWASEIEQFPIAVTKKRF